MYYTATKHSAHYRTARVFYIFSVFSNVRRALSQCNKDSLFVTNTDVFNYTCLFIVLDFKFANLLIFKYL